MKKFFHLLTLLACLFVLSGHAQRPSTYQYQHMTVLTRLDNDMTKHKGYLQSVSDTTVSLMLMKKRLEGETAVFHYSEINDLRIKKKRREHGLGILVGAGAGVVSGLLLGGLVTPHCDRNDWLCFRELEIATYGVGGLLFGGLFGGIIGLPTYATISIKGKKRNFDDESPRLRRMSFEDE